MGASPRNELNLWLILVRKERLFRGEKQNWRHLSMMRLGKTEEFCQKANARIEKIRLRGW